MSVSLTDHLVNDSLNRFLEKNCNPVQLRGFEAGLATRSLWDAVEAFGYANILLPEQANGAGLTLAELRPLIILMGRYLVPIPLAETIFARAVLQQFGSGWPDQPVVMVSPVRTNSGIFAAAVPLARTASLALVEFEGCCILTSLAAAEVVATGVHGSLAAHLHWSRPIEPIVTVSSGTVPLREIAATIRAAQMLGAMEKLLEMSLCFVKTREQFGRPLANFQAIQQQLAVMAEQVLGTDMAVQMAFTGGGITPRPLLAAVAKQRASLAASRVTATAHAVHGAIGLSEEYDLQLYCRRLHEWRCADGTATYWSRRIGESRVKASGHTLDFIREHLTAEDCWR